MSVRVRRLYYTENSKVLTVAGLVARNAKDAMVARVIRYDGVCVWLESEVWSQAVGFLLVFLARMWLQSP
jgi:hypothetical protein